MHLKKEMILQNSLGPKGIFFFLKQEKGASITFTISKREIGILGQNPKFSYLSVIEPP